VQPIYEPFGRISRYLPLTAEAAKGDTSRDIWVDRRSGAMVIMNSEAAKNFGREAAKNFDRIEFRYCGFTDVRSCV
jgi:hypothetical protein